MDSKSKKYLLIGIPLIIFAIIITYVITNQNISLPKPQIEEYPVSSSKYIKEQEALLKSITKNYNNTNISSKYLSSKDNTKATVEGNSIVVKYKNDNVDEEYDFILDNETLSTSIPANEKDTFINIFKLMIEANQIRLGNKNDLTEFFNKHLNDSSLNNAIIINQEEDTIEYIININKTIN